jgi:3-oxoadipate enol-lactonase/3-oxoadipate enol-lactonase/4-carboxymuconolactone decarboxylase
MNSLAHLVAGPETGPAVVLLHAITTSSELWRPQLPAWTSRFRVIALDLPGHGGSAPLPPGAGFADYAAAVAGTLADLGVGRAAFVGLSFGAMVGLRLAAEHPERVSAIVLANCVAKAPPPVRQAWRERIANVRAAGLEPQIEPTLSRWFTPAFAASAPMTLDWVRGLIRSTTPEGFCTAAAAISELDQLELAGSLRAPALVLAGEHDVAAPLTAMRALADAIPGSIFDTLDAAHLSNVEQATPFAERAGRFLQNHS